MEKCRRYSGKIQENKSYHPVSRGVNRSEAHRLILGQGPVFNLEQKIILWMKHLFPSLEKPGTGARPIFRLICNSKRGYATIKTT